MFPPSTIVEFSENDECCFSNFCHLSPSYLKSLVKSGDVSPNPRFFRHERKTSAGAVYVKQLFSDTAQRSPKETIKIGRNFIGNLCRIAVMTGNRAQTFPGGILWGLGAHPTCSSPLLFLVGID